MDQKELATIKCYPAKDFWVTCECHADAFRVTDFEWDEGVGCINVSMYRIGSQGAILDWKERLRWCWNILKSGLPWNDELTITPEIAKEMGEDLICRAGRYLTASPRQ
jgi:hypothetical protein